jgi:hypothetical protein
VVKINTSLLDDDVNEIEQAVTDKEVIEVEGGNEGGNEDKAVNRTQDETSPNDGTWL